MTVKLKQQGSVSQQRAGFGVAASPFNAVKFDLAVILIVAVLLLLTHGRLVTGSFAQFLLLGGYGLAAMAWLMLRTRRVLLAEQRNRAIVNGDSTD